jgi:hypothetical protein
MLKKRTNRVTTLSEASSFDLILLEVWKDQKRVKNARTATATPAQARYSVIIEVYLASRRNRLVAKIMEKKIVNTETPF